VDYQAEQAMHFAFSELTALEKETANSSNLGNAL
jgi:hypothetical protein